jgi:[acyl-carrier-protein] S-malonyltransferase
MLAFTFPGQGSQRPGMGRPWADHPSWELIGEASLVTDRDLGRLLLDADADELKDTRNAQLTTFVSSLMVLDAVERLGIEPDYCAGHSLGEYTALTGSGALSFEEGLRLVIERADAMHEAGADNPGTMAAVLGLDDDDVEIACRRADNDVWVANFNAPGQVVIAGHKTAVARAIEACKARGAKRAMPLPVSAPFHSSLMQPAALKLGVYLNGVQISVPGIPVLNNVDVRQEQDPVKIKDALVRQAASPVRWVEIIRSMAAQGVTHVVECGPGKVLAGLVKRIDPNLQGIAAADRASLEAALAAVKGG